MSNGQTSVKSIKTDFDSPVCAKSQFEPGKLNIYLKNKKKVTLGLLNYSSDPNQVYFAQY